MLHIFSFVVALFVFAFVAAFDQYSPINQMVDDVAVTEIETPGAQDVADEVEDLV